MKKAPDPKSMDIKALSLERRLAIVDDWIAAAFSVAERSSIPRAGEAANFLLGSTGVGIPWPNGGIYMVHTQKPKLEPSRYAFQ